MIYPDSRFQFTSNKDRRKKRFLIRIAVVAVLAVAAGGVTFALISGRLKEIPLNVAGEPQVDLPTLWDAGDYEGVVAFCENRLRESPMDVVALMFNGFAQFYIGASQITIEERMPYLDRSIAMLRKASLISNLPLPGEVEYILGKAYFHKGKYFADLAALYMQRSIERGLIREDSYEYLGLAYSQLGEYRRSIEQFLAAAERNPSDLLYLTIAQGYFQEQDLSHAESYLMKALEIGRDITLQQKSRSLLGEVYLKRQEYENAEKEYRKILELNPKSADAHFSLGELYHLAGDSVRARAEWRASLRIDPNHYGARLRLFPGR